MNSQSPNSSEQRLNVDKATIENSLIGQSERDIFQHSVVTFNHTEIIQSSVEDIKIRKFIKTSPYKGLNKFDSEDKDLFFGRDQFLTSLVNELEQTNLILLLGASGSGKSSVVRAGLIPWLSQKWGSHFVKLVFTPDSDPFAKLYASLQDKYNQTETKIAREVKEETLSLVVKKLKKSDEYWLIFIDQFEELFTTSLYEKRNLFINSLVQLNATEQNSVKIIATMRADFLDRLSPYPQLVKATDKHRPMIAEMQQDELRLAIEQPAAHHGVVFEQGLVSEIIKDIQGQAGYLPLLQYTLNLLWETEVKNNNFEQNRTLKISTYRQLGGVQGALQKHIDGIYGSLSDDEKRATQKIFLKLVDIGEDTESNDEWKAVRKRAPKSAFTTELEQELLTKLINQNLLVSDRTSEFEEATIDITHEILLTSWPTLNDWIKENRQALAIRSRLNNDMNLWKTKKSEDELWTGSKLEQVLELRRDPAFNQVLGGFSQDENQFIDLSAGLRDKRRSNRMMALVGCSIGALLLAGVAVTQWYGAKLTEQKAVDAEKIAVQEKQNAEQAAKNAKQARLNTLIKNAYELAKDEKYFDALQQSLNLAKEWPLNKLNKIPMQLLATLDLAVNKMNETRLEGHGSAVRSVAFSQYSEKIVSADIDGIIKVWDVEKGTSQDVENDTQVNTVAFSKDGEIFASGDQNGKIKLWYSNNLKSFDTLEYNGQVYSIAFSSDGKTLAAGGYDGKIILWDFKTGKKIISLEYNYRSNIIYSIAFSPDGKTLAAGGYDGTGNVQLWDIEKETQTSTSKEKQTPKILKQHNFVYSIAFSSDGNTLAVADYDGTIKFWDFKTGTEIRKPLRQNAKINSIAFSSDGTTLASADDNGIVQLWEVEDIAKVKKLGFWNYGGPVYSIQFSPTGKTLASGSWEGTVKLWNLNQDKTHSNLLSNNDSGIVEISYDGKIAAKRLDSNQPIQLSDIDTGKMIAKEFSSQKNNLQFNRIAFSPNNQILAYWYSPEDTDANQTDNNTNKSDDNINKNTIHLWDVNIRSVIPKKEYNTNGDNKVEAVAFSYNNERIAYGDENGIIKIVDLKTGKEEYRFDNNSGKIKSLAFHPQDDKLIAVLSSDETIKLWELKKKPETKAMVKEGKYNNTKKNSKVKSQENSPEKTISMAFSPNGQIIAYSNQLKIILWDVNTKKEITSFRQEQGVDSLAFLNDKTLAAAGRWGTIKLWDISTPNSAQEIATLSWPGSDNSPVKSITFAFDSTKTSIVANNYSGQMYKWDFNPEKLIQRGCNWMQSYLKNSPNVSDEDKKLCDGIKTKDEN